MSLKGRFFKKSLWLGAAAGALTLAALTGIYALLQVKGSVSVDSDEIFAAASAALAGAVTALAVASGKEKGTAAEYALGLGLALLVKVLAGWALFGKVQWTPGQGPLLAATALGYTAVWLFRRKRTGKRKRGKSVPTARRR